MEKNIDLIGFDDDGRFDLESFANVGFEPIKALTIAVAKADAVETEGH